MSSPGQVQYQFGSFRLIPTEKQLIRDGKAVPLQPKVFDTLLLLVESQGRLLEKDELLKRLWPDSFVEEVALAHNISQLRKALDERSDQARFIETVPKRGYRFIAPVESVAPATAVASRITVAVLPFENLGPGDDREYLADGFTEETIATLGQIDPDRLSVIGRTSMMAYKRTTKALGEIGRELGAEFLVESSVRAERGKMRITSRLIRTRDQSAVWTASYDGEPASVLEFQRELSTTIAEQVRLRLSPERLGTLARRHTRNAEAYDLYMRGLYFSNRHSVSGTQRAIECFTRATALDPEYALAWSGLANAYSTSTITNDAPPSSMAPLAREAARRAVSADANLAAAQTSLGMIHFWFDWNWLAAEAALRSAIQLDPSYAVAHRRLGILLGQTGRHTEAHACAGRTQELDPLLAMHYVLSAQVAFTGRDYAAALAFARQAIALDPELRSGRHQSAQAYERLGEFELALNELDLAARFSPDNGMSLSLRGYVFARAGRAQEACEVLSSLQAISHERYIPPSFIAMVYTAVAEQQLALEWLEHAFEVHDVHLVRLPADPKWDPLRDHPQFRDLLQRCGFLKRH
jgi:DNA-binding winged helix-turn-helix (wHTH) protein/Flp pilus assembly protein TadD